MALEISSERLQRIVEKARLEGVLASPKHVGKLASDKMTLEELKQKVK